MSKKSKQLSNPFSTGGGGVHFEAHVQASFVVLMLAGGSAPCMPNLPITKIKLQGKVDGYDTDDLIIFVEKPGTNQKRKILGQIKHALKITEKDKVFGDVIQAAWNDFNNSSVFSKDSDIIALITGSLSQSDSNDIRFILDGSRTSNSAEEFIKRVEVAKFSSRGKQNKLRAFRSNLKKANNNSFVSDAILFDFLRHFYILSYDLDSISGVNLSLLHSLLAQFSQDDASRLWALIVDEVQSSNKNAGTISPENISSDLKAAFAQRTYAVIPNEFSSPQISSDAPGWNRLSYASELAIANLLGSWNEQNEADIKIIRQLVNKDSESWLSTIREILHQPTSPLALRNGKWRVIQRENLWDALGTRIFDKDLDNFKTQVISALTERDPQFDLPIRDRFAASMFGKTLKNSPELRKGMAESLAILGNRSHNLVNCSLNKPEIVAVFSVRKILENADWVLWGSLNDLLPLLAEAAPNEFLKAVENALQQSPCPFDQLFPRESSGITGRNYITGLLWALETLAWEEEFLVRACVLLGELATHDTGETNWANRPSNSLRTIFLPWFPQTKAPVEKRKVAIQTLMKEVPEIAWRLLLNLLPNQNQFTSGSYKPSWRTKIPDDWGTKISQQEYWGQILSYADLAVSIASNSIDKLTEIIGQLNNLPKPSFDKILQILSSEKIVNQPEDQRLHLWTSLTNFVSKHKRYSDAKQALPAEIASKIEEVTSNIAPTNPLNLYRRLFDNREYDLYEENQNWEEKRKKLEERRKTALQNILSYGGINAIFQFAETVEAPFLVGYILAIDGKVETDQILLPAYLDTENKNFLLLAGGYVWNSQQIRGLPWVDELDKSNWSLVQIGQFLRCLPFTDETWMRVTQWLDDAEKEYWAKVNVNPYGVNADFRTAMSKLIDYGRPNAAIACLSQTLYAKQSLDKQLSVKALLSAVSSKEPSYEMDVHNITEIIKALQNDTETNPDDLFQVEWAYLPLLDHYGGSSPQTLEFRLASDSSFFCEVIRLVYRSKKENKPKAETSENEKAIATNAWRLLHEWRTPPGVSPERIFSEEKFSEWFEKVKMSCAESGHLEVALTHIGHVLFYCPPDPSGLWINRVVADVLNAKDADDIRNGFNSEIYNSRGVHWIDPTGKPEKELAENYRKKAEDVENAGYQRLAAMLRVLAEEYIHEAERIIAEHKREQNDEK